MEWSKAKNFILILLIIINIFLLVLNLYKIKTNSVSVERIRNIMNICEDYDTEINCKLPERIIPTSRLSIKKYDYDYIKLQQIFFGTITDVQRTDYLTNVIFTKGKEKLTVEGSKVIFNTDKKEYEGYINSLTELLGSFDIERKAGNSIYYFQKYREMPVFSNYISVDTLKDNTITITLNYSEVLKSTGNRQDTIGADEAIYYAINKISEDISGEKSIKAVEKGYYDNRTSLNQEGAIPPVYAIYVNDRIYYVNAYTGSCYK
ncbi:MAG: two-component system regulatory protein YycI [Lachnospirales bacterium]